MKKSGASQGQSASELVRQAAALNSSGKSKPSAERRNAKRDT